MYTALLPGVAFTILLWHPPRGLSADGLFWYLLFMAVGCRASLTLYEIPSTSLVPELTTSYDTRTRILSYRMFCGYVGAVVLMIGAQALLLTPSAPGKNDGILNINGYRSYGTIAACTVAVSILTSAIGTHRYIPYLRQPAPRRGVCSPRSRPR